MKKHIKTYFFTARILFWTLILPLGNGLYLYFLYLPFARRSVILEFNSLSFMVDLVGFTLVGQLLYSFFTMMLLAGVTFEVEREQGTLEMVLLTPANRVAILLGSALAGTFNYMWMIIGVILSWIGFLHVNIVVNDFMALFLAVALSYLSLVALGMSLEAFFIYSRRGGMFGTMLQEPIMFLSGLIFPLQSMPRFLLLFSYLLPLTFGLISVRLTLLGGARLCDVVFPLTILASMIVILFLLGTWLISYAEKSAKRKATLTQF